MAIQIHNSEPEENPEESKPRGIDFQATTSQLSVGLQYISETREDLEKNGPQKWITTLVEVMQKADQKLRALELDHSEDLVTWRDEDGIPHQVLVRMQDEKGFDAAEEEFNRAESLFEDYFMQHAKYLKSQE